MSIKTHWLFQYIPSTLLHAYLTGWHTLKHVHLHTSLTRPSLGSWCWVSWWSPATLEKDRERGSSEGGNGKTPLAFDEHFSFHQITPQKSLHPWKTLCVFSQWVVFFFPPLHFTPSSLLASSNLTTSDRTGSFPHLLLLHPSPHNSQMIHKQMILPCRTVPFHLIYTAILSQLFGIVSDSANTQASQDRTNIHYLSRLDKFDIFTHLETDRLLLVPCLTHSLLSPSGERSLVYSSVLFH